MSAGDGFFKRGKIWWFRTDPITGKQASSGKRDRRSAEIEYTTRARLASDPSYQPETEASVSLNHWAVKFVEHKRATKAGHTADFYAAKLGHVVRLFGAHTAISVALRPQSFDQYALTRKSEGARATTIRKEIGAARTLARFAARHGAYHGRPELFMPGDLADDYEPGERFLTPPELYDLTTHLPKHRAAWVCLAVATGCRYSETTRITAADVDLDGMLVTIRGTKTKRARAVVPVAEPFQELLRWALPYLPLRPWLNANMKRDLALACSKAGIEPVTANDLRRTHGSWLAQAGVGDEHIGKVLRHADGRMARRVYGRLPPEQLGRLVNATIVQQLPARGESPATETPAESPASDEPDGRIENPRVGGSIPSRDTAEIIGSYGFLDDPKFRCVTQADAKSRSVRNESATAAPTVESPRLGPRCGQTEDSPRGSSAGRAPRRITSEVAGSNPAPGTICDASPRLGPRCGQSESVALRCPGCGGNVGECLCGRHDSVTGWLGPLPPPVVAQEFPGLREAVWG
jgi:integrase